MSFGVLLQILVPVVLACREHGLGVLDGRGLVHHVRAGADRFGLDAFGSQRLGAAHQAGGLAEEVLQGGVRGGEVDVDGVGVHNGHVLDGGELRHLRTVGLLEVVDVGLGGLGVELGTVTEGDAAAQVHGQLGVGGVVLPGRGQHGAELAVRLAQDQGVVDRLVRLEHVAYVGLGRIPGPEVLDGAQRQGRGRGACGCAACCSAAAATGGEREGGAEDEGSSCRLGTELHCWLLWIA